MNNDNKKNDFNAKKRGFSLPREAYTAQMPSVKPPKKEEKKKKSEQKDKNKKHN